MKQFVRKLVRDESGATAIEYGLIAAIISVAIIVALTSLQGALNSTFEAITTALESRGSGGTP